MAAAAHVTAGIYGTIAGQPPYTGANPFANFNQFATPVQMSFPTGSTIFHQVTPGQQVGNSSNYIYAVIEVTQDGFVTQPRTMKYATNVSVATLATNAG